MRPGLYPSGRRIPGTYSGSIPARSALTHFRTDDKMIAEYLLSRSKAFCRCRRRKPAFKKNRKHVRKRR